MLSEVLSPVPFGVAFWVAVFALRSDSWVDLAVFAVGLALSAALDRMARVATDGWEAAYPRATGVVWLFEGWGHRPAAFAAQRAGLPVRPVVVGRYLGVGVLASAWLSLAVAGLLTGTS